MNIYDIVVIGGGTSGMMASIAAASYGAKVLVIEKNKQLGKKLLITGGGRCNVTNKKDTKDLIHHIPGNGKFLYSAFSVFNSQDCIDFFENEGVLLKEEDHGRMFPVSDQAKTIVDALYQKMKSLGVTIVFNTSVTTIRYKNKQVYSVCYQDTEILCQKVIVACGGRTAPETGSTGDGYSWAKRAGHTIIPLYPTEVPLVSKEPCIQKNLLQGVALRNCKVTVLNSLGKEVVSHQRDLLFTHFGVSGPVALHCSMFVQQIMKKEEVSFVTLKIDALPQENHESLLHKIKEKQKTESNKSLKNILKQWIPESYSIFLLSTIDIDPTIKMKELSNIKIEEILQCIKNFKFKVHGTLALEKAFVTGGGVSTKEIQAKTMESKKIKGLYFTGEIIDIHGYTGGYNITAAFSTGYVAGSNAALSLEE